jgi:hypothetical protein
MKKLLILIALICAAQFSNAQSDSTQQPVDTLAMYSATVDTMTIAFTAPVGTEMYVYHYTQDPGVKLQISLATRGVDFTDSILSDDNYTATITITGKQVIECFKMLRNVPEGYGADENKKLLTALMPNIMQSPALAYVVSKMRDYNENTVLYIKRDGANGAKGMQKLLE